VSQALCGPTYWRLRPLGHPDYVDDAVIGKWCIVSNNQTGMHDEVCGVMMASQKVEVGILF